MISNKAIQTAIKLRKKSKPSTPQLNNKLGVRGLALYGILMLVMGQS